MRTHHLVFICCNAELSEAEEEIDFCVIKINENAIHERIGVHCLLRQKKVMR